MFAWTTSLGCKEQLQCVPFESRTLPQKLRYAGFCLALVIVIVSTPPSYLGRLTSCFDLVVVCCS